MTTAEATSKTIVQITPNSGKKFAHVYGTSAADSDTMTVTGFKTVEGCLLKAVAGTGTTAQGTVATYTISTNVITLTNGGTAIWSGMVWGY